MKKESLKPNELHKPNHCDECQKPFGFLDSWYGADHGVYWCGKCWLKKLNERDVPPWPKLPKEQVELAEDILAYAEKIRQTKNRCTKGELTGAEAHIAIEAWEEVTKLAWKKLKALQKASRNG